MIRVAVGAIVRDQQVLLARRAEDAHQGGLWEFPGGKIEADESLETALSRELQEELGIIPMHSRPLITIQHDYGDKSVSLEVCQVEQWNDLEEQLERGVGRENQPLQWIAFEDLTKISMPAANRPIAQALRLPNHYTITPEPQRLRDKDWWYGLEAALDRQLDAVPAVLQLRAKLLLADSERDYCRFAEQVLNHCFEHKTRLLLNAPPQIALSVGSDGVHLSNEEMHKHQQRPIAEYLWLSTACHDIQEAEQTQHLQADMTLVSPVQKTASHPDAEPLKWEGFQELADKLTCPAYALGGMQHDDVETAWQHGGQGIAAIQGLWKELIA